MYQRTSKNRYWDKLQVWRQTVWRQTVGGRVVQAHKHSRHTQPVSLPCHCRVTAGLPGCIRLDLALLPSHRQCLRAGYAPGRPASLRPPRAPAPCTPSCTLRAEADPTGRALSAFWTGVVCGPGYTRAPGRYVPSDVRTKDRGRIRKHTYTYTHTRARTHATQGLRSHDCFHACARYKTTRACQQAHESSALTMRMSHKGCATTNCAHVQVRYANTCVRVTFSWKLSPPNVPLAAISVHP